MQIVIVPIIKIDTIDKVKEYTDKIKNILEKTDYSFYIDDSNERPGKKYNHWEIRGVPVRIEFGAKDVDNNTVCLVRRDTFKKINVNFCDLYSELLLLMKDIQDNLFNNAKNNLINNLEVLTDIKKMNHNPTKLYLVPLCNDESCEEYFKDNYDIKSLCMPCDDTFGIEEFKGKCNDKCIICDKEKTNWCLFGKSY